jgi:8-oxo-dGTP diphosphatase
MTNSLLNLEHLLHNISVSCVIFGCDKESLKVLLIKTSKEAYSIPENLVNKHEHLQLAVKRVVKNTTALEHLEFKQFRTFGYSPHQDESKKEESFRKSITVGYYTLINVEKVNLTVKNAQWVSISDIPSLLFDHQDIIDSALQHLRNAFLTQQEGFDLLPKKFTLTELQCLYEVILDKRMDKRNFRKLIIEKPFLKPLKSIEKGKAHRPAKLYTFKQVAL